MEASSTINTLLLKGIVHLKDYAIQTLCANGYLQSCNFGTEYLTAYTQKDILHQHLSMLFQDANEAEMLLTHIKHNLQQDVWLKRKDGSVFRANVSLAAIVDQQQLQGYLCIFQDKTEQYQKDLLQQQQLERYSYALEGANVGIWDRDLSDDTIFWNSRAKEIYDISNDESHCYTTFLKHIHPDDQNRVQKTLAAHLKNSKPYEIEYRIVRSSGEINYCLSRGKTVELKNGKATRLIGAVLDITRLKLAEQENKHLHEQLEKRFSATFQQAAVGFAHAALNSKWTRVNAKMCEIFGYSESELCKLTFQETTYPEDLPEDLENVRKLLAGEISNYAMQKRFIRKDGSLVWTNLTVSLVRDKDNKPEYFISVVEDITQRKNAEFKLQQTFQKLQASQIKLNNIINSNIAGIFFWNPKTTVITDANDNFLRMIGYNREDIAQGKINRRSISPPESKENDLKVIKKVFSEGTVNNYEKYYIRKDGERINVLINFLLLNENEGIAFVKDITMRKKAEQALLESEQRFRKLAEDAPIMMWMTDQEGRAVYANKAWLEFIGEIFENYIGKFRYEIECVHPDDRKQVAEKAIDCTKKQSIYTQQMRYLRYDGEYRWISMTANPRFTITGEYIGHVGICQDFTESKIAKDNLTEFTKELEKRVYERTKEIEAINKELEAFSYSVSHDLRAPLRSIDGFSNIIASRYAALLDEQGQEYFHYIRENTRRMGQLIDDLLLLSKISRAELKLEYVNLSNMVEEILRYIHLHSPDRKVQFQITPNIIAKADPRLVRIALDNLLSNAWKFTSKIDSAQIEFTMELDHNHVIYLIRDNGAGFDMKFSNKLFGAFQRLHSITDFPGTGIGLATVQRIIHRHQGCIWASGKVGRGATFFFTLQC